MDLGSIYSVVSTIGILGFLKSKQGKTIIYGIKKAYTDITSSTKLIDSLVEKELNKLDDQFIESLNHHPLIDNVKDLINNKIPLIFIESKKGKAQSVFAYCTIILMKCYLEAFLQQVMRLRKAKKITKEIAINEILTILGEVLQKASDEMVNLGIPIEVVVIYSNWYEKSSSSLIRSIKDSLMMCITSKDVIRNTVCCSNNFVYDVNILTESLIDKFNGEVSKYLFEDVYLKIDFKNFKHLKAHLN